MRLTLLGDDWLERAGRARVVVGDCITEKAEVEGSDDWDEWEE